MDLAKQCVDVGIFTNKLEEMQAFYGDRLGLQFESVLPVGGGMRQHRYLANGSVVKLMHSREPLRPREAAGYNRLVIADPKVSAPQELTDPDGNIVEIVPPGYNGVTQIEVHLGVSDPDAYERFYGDAIGARRLAAGRYLVGETIFTFSKSPEAKTATHATPFANALDVVKAMAALGMRYVTMQVRNCDAAYKALTSAGASEAIAPLNFGTVARICFVRDPDGNFVEISQRPPS
jgi:catechol 2,3-dioxygenase-like lactoylglutathione lyase family enzyme